MWLLEVLEDHKKQLLQAGVGRYKGRGWVRGVQGQGWWDLEG